MKAPNFVRHLKDLIITLEQNPFGAVSLVTIVYFVTMWVGLHS
jgi:hypothetical protein